MVAFKFFTSTQLITLNYPVIQSHRRSTTVSLEITPLLPSSHPKVMSPETRVRSPEIVSHVARVFSSEKHKNGITVSNIKDFFIIELFLFILFL